MRWAVVASQVSLSWVGRTIGEGNGGQGGSHSHSGSWPWAMGYRCLVPNTTRGVPARSWGWGSVEQDHCWGSKLPIVLTGLRRE